MDSMIVDLDPYFIRNIEAGDVDALARHANNRNVAANLRDRFPHPYHRKDAEEFVARMTQEEVPSVFAIATREELIGGIGLHPQEDVHIRSAEIGYWLAEPYWGKGIMSRAVAAFTEFAFANRDLIRIFAVAFHTNPGSVRVLEKCGYQYEGCMKASAEKWGQVLDQFIYAMVRVPTGSGSRK
jgi:ribosomal-protein-alanine N-acetyltransferase